ncbi:MAG: magnesium transporter [Endozoicomonadaceae bacterium]|nr:magnesium transporter [Endozoicomonadaceae bacterium]
MTESTLQPLSNEQLSLLNEQLSHGISDEAREMLNTLPPEDIAYLLESCPLKQRSLLWKLIDVDIEGDVLTELDDEVRNFFLESMNSAELAKIISDQDSDDLADILQQLPDKIAQQVLTRMKIEDRKRVESVLSYPEDTAGGMMNTDTICVYQDISLALVLKYFKQGHKLSEPLDHIYVLDQENKLVGVLSFVQLLIRDTHCKVKDVMAQEYQSVHVEEKSTDVANLFERRNLVSAPVVDSTGHLLGRITIDDVVDVIRDEADHSLMNLSGLGEHSDTFAGVLNTAKNRALWLCINLIAAFASAGVIGFYQDTIAKVVALAVLMPVVSSMGGSAGSQAMILVIRALSQGQLNQSNMRWLLLRELGVGLLNGILWGTVVSLIAWLWFNNTVITGVIALAVLINLTSAVTLGAILPGILRKMNIDPTLAGTVVLTTSTDIIGLCSFLGMAALFF